MTGKKKQFKERLTGDYLSATECNEIIRMYNQAIGNMLVVLEDTTTADDDKVLQMKAEINGLLMMLHHFSFASRFQKRMEIHQKEMNAMDPSVRLIDFVLTKLKDDERKDG